MLININYQLNSIKILEKLMMLKLSINLSHHKLELLNNL
jgi:hypothetical protein